jgi:hypothetical protein
MSNLRKYVVALQDPGDSCSSYLALQAKPERDGAHPPAQGDVRPALDAALAAVTAEGGEPQLDLLDDDQRQALRIYETAGEPEWAELVQQDFLASLQLSVI